MSDQKLRHPSRSRISVGHVVVREEGGQRMTVTRIVQGTFGAVAHCAYFDEDACLQTPSYPVRILSQRECLQAPLPASAEADVQLKSGGPSMRAVFRDVPDGWAFCLWTGPESVSVRKRFPVLALRVPELDAGGYERLAT
jgi:uncharacterized protein YodC (DUF2158 family)